MLPLRRAKQAWCFLSLDHVSQFSTELWIPSGNVNAFQAELQKQLTPWLTVENFHKEGEAMSYSMAEWYQRVFGSEALDNLFLWIKEIFLYDGPDRMAEVVWNIVPYRAEDVAPEFPEMKWFFELLTQVRNEQEAARA